MIFELSALIPTLFLCFFLLFMFSRHDFVLLRQNISLSEVFDLSLITAFFGFVVGRIFYILDSFSFNMLNVVKFIYLPRFPGVSSIGFFMGAAFGIYLLFRNKKGIARILDIFSLSFYPLFVFFHEKQSLLLHKNYVTVLFLILSIPIFIFFVRAHNKYLMRDGNISALFLFLVLIVNFIFQYFARTGHPVLLNLSFIQFISIPAAVLSIAFVVTNNKKK